MPIFESFPITLSFSSLLNNFSSNLEKKVSTMANSQSHKRLEKYGIQWPLVLVSSYKSSTQASLDATKAYKERKEVHKGFSTHHLSFQILTLLSLPTSKEALLNKRSHPYSLPNFKLVSISYFLGTPLWSILKKLPFRSNFQLHFPRRA